MSGAWILAATAGGLGEAAGIPGLLAGAVLLLFGRRLYWLFVGLAGFVFGLFLAERLAEGEPGWVALVAGIVVGALAALLAVFFQKAAVAIAGFLAAGLLFVRGMLGLGYEPAWWVWLLALFAGLLGGLITRWLFELGLIALSSLLGAALIVQSADTSGGAGWRGWAFLGLAVVGIAVQLASTGPAKRVRRAGASPGKTG